MLMKFINGCISDAQKEFEHNSFLEFCEKEM